MDSNTPNDGRQFVGTPNECGNSEGLELIRKSLKKIQIDEEKRQGKMAGGEPSHIFVIFGASGDLDLFKGFPNQLKAFRVATFIWRTNELASIIWRIRIHLFGVVVYRCVLEDICGSTKVSTRY
jgi:hypothetical protein